MICPNAGAIACPVAFVGSFMRYIPSSIFIDTSGILSFILIDAIPPKPVLGFFIKSKVALNIDSGTPKA